MNRATTKILLALVPLGILARLALSTLSWGSNDATTWRDFGKNISQNGLLQIYHSDPAYNHPLLPGVWAASCFRAASWAQQHVHTGSYAFPWFPYLFKLAPIAADAVTCWLLWKIWLPRAGAFWAAAAAAIYAWNPVAILVSVHHCNTDSIYAMLCLAAVYLIQDFGAWFWGGLLLGAAINVKLIPVLLIPPLAVTCGDVRRLTRFAVALAIMALPFLPPLLGSYRHDFVDHALKYASYPCEWGISLFFIKTKTVPAFAAVVGDMHERYLAQARWLILAAVYLLTMWVHRHRNQLGLDRYTIGAMTMALFLILTPGFGIQYAVCVLPLLSAVSFGRTVLYSFLAGMMLLMSYWLMWQLVGLPLETFGGGSPQGPGPVWGLLTWAVLIHFVWSRMRPSNRRAVDGMIRRVRARV